MARCLAAALVICAGLALGGCGEKDEVQPQEKPVAAVQTGDFGLDQHGNTVKAAQIEGHWLVLNYWAEWCGPCRIEIPELNAAAKQWQAEGIKVVGVNYDGLQGDDLKQSAQTLGIDFTVLATDPAPRYQLPRSEALPVTYIIDDQGKVREQLMGEQTFEGLQAKIKALKGA